MTLTPACGIRKLRVENPAFRGGSKALWEPVRRLCVLVSLGLRAGRQPRHYSAICGVSRLGSPLVSFDRSWLRLGHNSIPITQARAVLHTYSSIRSVEQLPTTYNRILLIMSTASISTYTQAPKLIWEVLRTSLLRPSGLETCNTAHTHPIPQLYLRLIAQHSPCFLNRGIPRPHSILDTSPTQRCYCRHLSSNPLHYPWDKLGAPAYESCNHAWHLYRPRRHMPKLRPYRQAEVTKRDRCAVRNENRLARRRSLTVTLDVWRRQIVDGKNVRVGDVVDMGEIVQIVASSEEERGLVQGDTGVDAWDELVVAWTEDDRWAQDTGLQMGWGVGGQDNRFGCGLVSNSARYQGAIREATINL